MCHIIETAHKRRADKSLEIMIVVSPTSWC
jgi:hypothetical protein